MKSLNEQDSKSNKELLDTTIMKEIAEQTINNSGFPAHISGEFVQSCEEHCRNTAQYAERCLESVGLGTTAFLSGLLHDCGKFSVEFKEYISKAVLAEDVRKGSVIHTFAGPYYLLTKFHAIDAFDPYKYLSSELMAYAIGAHHGLFDCISEDRKNGFLHRLTKQPDYEKKAIAFFNHYCCNDEDIEQLFMEATKEIELFSNKISKIADSNSEISFYLGLLARLLCSAVMDGDRRDTAEFMTRKDFRICQTGSTRLWKECHSNLEQTVFSFPNDTMIQQSRREISDICADFGCHNPGGVYKLNVPTGGGKTLSSLRYALAHAEHFSKKRIIYTAPLISILDQNSAVIRSAIKRDDIVLEHHSNIVRTEKNEEQLSKYELLTDTWDAPIIITTLVQLLNTMFSGKTSCVRRFQSLCESILIIDEVQTIPLKMMSMFNLTINFLSKFCGTTVILCSATQPCFDELESHKMLILEKDIIPVKKYECYKKVFKRTNVIYAGSMSLDEITVFAEQVLVGHDSLLIICNTKKEATKVYDDLQHRHDNCFHLSASMCMSHRQDVTSQVYDSLEAGKKTILVSTQVIEAGVDISFAAVVRLTAGIDNIVQAAGRCNRSGEMGVLSPVYIVRCEDENLGTLTDIIRAQNATNNLISKYTSETELFDSDIASEKAINYYYKSLYNAAESNLFDFPVNHTSLFSLLSDNLQYSDGGEDSDKYILHQAFKTAGSLFELFDQNSESVIVPYREGQQIIAEMQTERAKHDLVYMMNLLEQAKKYSVSVYSNQINKLFDCGGVVTIADDSIFVLQEDWYDNKTGLRIEPVEREENECNILIS